MPDDRGELVGDQWLYPVRFVRFLLAHEEAYQAAHLGGNPGAARNEMKRLARELATLPSQHACSCNPYHCPQCAALAQTCEQCKQLPLRQRPSQCEWCDRLKGQDQGAEIGRGSLAHAPTPDVVLLDLARARGAGHRSAGAIARYLNGEGRGGQ